VKVNGFDNGHQGTVLNLDSSNGILVQMGSKSMYFDPELVTVMARSLRDRNGNFINVEFEVGDKVKYTYPNPPANPDDEQPIRYGEITGFVSEKRVNVRWIGSDKDKVERLSRLKWVPAIPGWFNRFYGD